MSRTAFFCIVMAAAALAPGVARAQETKTAPPAGSQPAASEAMTIYKDALGTGWENRSWAKTELAVDVGGSRKPIRVEAGPWQALYLHHAPFSAAPYRKLSLLIQSAQPGGQPVRIIALTGGKPITETGKVVTLKAGGWTQVEVPLASLGAENATIDGIWVQNGTDQALPVFYVADVALN